MSRKNIFLSLAILGALLPWILFLQFFQAEGIGGDFLGALFANGASGGFTVDLILSSLVFWIFLFREGRLKRMRPLWPYVLINLFIGLSCAFPLFLWARERDSSMDNI